MRQSYAKPFLEQLSYEYRVETGALCTSTRKGALGLKVNLPSHPSLAPAVLFPVGGIVQGK